MEKASYAGGAAGGGDRLRQLDVHAREIGTVIVRPALVAPPATAVKNADEIEYRLLIAREALEHSRSEDIGLEDIDGGQKDEVLCALATPRGHRNLDRAGGERRAEMPPDEARAAEDEHVLELHPAKTVSSALRRSAARRRFAPARCQGASSAARSSCREARRRKPSSPSPFSRSRASLEREWSRRRSRPRGAARRASAARGPGPHCMPPRQGRDARAARARSSCTRCQASRWSRARACPACGSCASPFSRPRSARY